MHTYTVYIYIYVHTSYRYIMGCNIFHHVDDVDDVDAGSSRSAPWCLEAGAYSLPAVVGGLEAQAPEMTWDGMMNCREMI